MHLVNRVLQLVDRSSGIQILRAGVRAVHNCMAAIQLVRIVQILQTLLGHLIARIGDPPIGLLQDGGAEVLIAVPPVGRAGRRAARAENALVQTVQKLAILARLQILHLVVRVHLRLLLQPRLDRRVLLVEVRHIEALEGRRARTRNEILDDEHVGKRTHGANLVVLRNLGQTCQTVLAVDVHGARTANTLTARSTVKSNGIHYLLKANVGSCSFLILNRASSTMVPQLPIIYSYIPQLVQINDVLLIVRLYVLVRVESEDREQLVGGLVHEPNSNEHTFFCSSPSFNPVAKEAENT